METVETWSPHRIISVGRIFFGVGLLGIGLQFFIYHNFIPVMVPWLPNRIPWHAFWIYAFGTLLVIVGLSIITGIKTRPISAISGLLFLASFVFLHIPHNFIAGTISIGAWTQPLKEFAFAGSAFVIAGLFASDGPNPGSKPTLLSKLEDFAIPVSKYPLAIMVIVFGADHFIYTTFVASLVPAWIPGHVFWTYFAGLALIAAGVGIIINVKARLAATMLGAMLLTWVIILHIPRAIADPYGRIGNEVTSVFEALAFSGIAFILGRILPKREE